ncbi:MAG: AI-2E family transporter [Ruminococcaceae bacterium]|nr:AI-2E family transporter [Oscillospiraceae bacterium]
MELFCALLYNIKEECDNLRRPLNKYLIISFFAVCTVAVSSLIIYFIFNFKVIAAFIGKLLSIMSPIFIGFAIAYLINPIVKLFENKVFTFKKAKKDRKRLKRALSISCSYILVLVAVAAVLAILIPQLYSSFDKFASNIKTYQATLENWSNSIFNKTGSYYPIVQKALELFDGIIDKGVDYITHLIPQALLLIKDVSVVIVNILVAVFVSIYMISRKEHLLAQIKKLVCSVCDRSTVKHLHNFMEMLDDSLGGFIRGKIIDSAIIGALCYVVMLILRLDYAMLISVIVGVTNVIPFFGPFIGAIPSAFILLMVNPSEVIPFLIAILLIQQLDGNFIGPKILGSSMGLSPFWVLVAIVVMSGLFGFVGMIIGVPIFSVLYNLAERLIDKRLEAKKLPLDLKEYYEAIPESKESDENKDKTE